MNDLDNQAFSALFKEAFEKCFGHSLAGPMTETESKLFYSKILDQTGLVIGWKSLKNYSLFIHDGGSKTQNPTVATMDTLARYVLDAPYLSETERKEKESHYPFWFEYKEKFLRQPKSRIISIQHDPSKKQFPVVVKKTAIPWIPPFILSFLVIVFFGFWLFIKYSSQHETITENFHDVSMPALASHGWIIQSPDTIFWNKRKEKPDGLTLYTLRGDTWPNAKEKTGIRNLLLRKVDANCFDAEVHFSDFLPSQNWQQAGILLLEDTNFTGRSVRLSVAFNDFFGGYKKPKEMIIQAITSLGKNDAEPEEIAHQPILYTDSAEKNRILFQNVANMSLRLEKRGNKFRFLYAGGSVSNPAFREVETHEFDIHPAYIGLFAIRGFVDSSAAIPVRFTFFRLMENKCE